MLCNALQITEDDAKLLLALRPPSDDQVHESRKVNTASVIGAFSPETTETLTGDTKLELPISAEEITAAANNLRALSRLDTVFDNAHKAIAACARQDCSTLADVASAVVSQIKTRMKTNPQLKTTYSSLLAYQRVRYPGRKTKAVHSTPKPAPGPTPNPAAAM
jgi:hypothetical protein